MGLGTLHDRQPVALPRRRSRRQKRWKISCVILLDAGALVEHADRAASASTISTVVLGGE
jgi:hypothetical protein